MIIDGKEYMEACLRTNSSIMVECSDNLKHGVIGLVTEAAECLEVANNQIFDRASLLYEIGDICWYMSILLSEFHSSWDELFKVIDVPNDIEVYPKEHTMQIMLSSVNLLDILKKHMFYCKTLDRSAFLYALGSLAFDIGVLISSLNSSWLKVWQMNIDKLKKRYPEGFDPERAKNREEENSTDLFEEYKREMQETMNPLMIPSFRDWKIARQGKET